MMDSVLSPPVTDVQFLRFAEGGRVHVFDRYENRLDVPLYQVQVAVCGRSGRPGQRHNIEPAFRDRELCARCWHGTPPEARPSLFEHPQEAA